MLARIRILVLGTALLPVLAIVWASRSPNHPEISKTPARALASETKQAIAETADAQAVLKPESGSWDGAPAGTKAERRKRVAAATALQKKIGECLVKDLCGEHGSVENPYFDPENTESNRLLNRALRYLKQEATADPNQDGLPGDSDLLDRLRVDNPETQILATELLLRNGSNPDLCSQLLGNVGEVGPDAKATYFALLGGRGGCDRGSVLSALQSSLQNDDVNAIQKLISNLDQMTLSERDFANIVSSLCYVKSDLKIGPTNWNELRYKLNKYSQSHGYSADTDSVCG